MRKMSFFASIFVCILTIGIFTSCSSNDTPGEISLSFWNEMKKGNYEKAIDIWFSNADEDITSKAKGQGMDMKAMMKGFSGKIKEEMDKKGGIKSVELQKEEIDEEAGTASVSILVTMGDGSTETDNTEYKKVDGKWRINQSPK